MDLKAASDRTGLTILDVIKRGVLFKAHLDDPGVEFVVDADQPKTVDGILDTLQKASAEVEFEKPNAELSKTEQVIDLIEKIDAVKTNKGDDAKSALGWKKS